MRFTRQQNEFGKTEYVSGETRIYKTRMDTESGIKERWVLDIAGQRADCGTTKRQMISSAEQSLEAAKAIINDGLVGIVDSADNHKTELSLLERQVAEFIAQL